VAVRSTSGTILEDVVYQTLDGGGVDVPVLATQGPDGRTELPHVAGDRESCRAGDPLDLGSLVSLQAFAELVTFGFGVT
jgi:hypothetical protein